WKEFPEQRAELVGRLWNDEIWRMPEMYDYARQAVLPAEGDARVDAWAAVSNIWGWDGDGKVIGVATRLLDTAGRQNKAEPLARDVEAALKKFPDWTGGKALLAVLCARRGQHDQAKKLIEAVLKDA